MNRSIKLQYPTGNQTVKRANLTVTGFEKFVSSGTRRIRGVASTNKLDLQGDVVEPSGGSWDLPLPLLWAHKHENPIGWVRSIDRSGDALTIGAEIASGAGMADEVWGLIEAGLVDGFSIGFIGEKYEPLPGGGKRFTKWRLIEISAVVIPANPDARIQRSAARAPIQLTRRKPIQLIKSPPRRRPIRLTPGYVRLIPAPRKKYSPNPNRSVQLICNDKGSA